eukprot:3555939-Amphidinium_carterae.1
MAERYFGNGFKVETLFVKQSRHHETSIGQGYQCRGIREGGGEELLALHQIHCPPYLALRSVWVMQCLHQCRLASSA